MQGPCSLLFGWKAASLEQIPYLRQIKQLIQPKNPGQARKHIQKGVDQQGFPDETLMELLLSVTSPSMRDLQAEWTVLQIKEEDKAWKIEPHKARFLKEAYSQGKTGAKWNQVHYTAKDFLHCR